MKVENTPTRLELCSRPWALWLYSAFFPIVGLAFLTIMFQIHSLTCKRTEQAQDTCEISHFTTFGINSQKIPLNKLKEARVQESSDSETGTTYKVVLLTTDGEELSLRSYFDNFDDQGKRDTASRINAFLQNSKESSLSIQQYPELFSSLSTLAWNGFV